METIDRWKRNETKNSETRPQAGGKRVWLVVPLLLSVVDMVVNNCTVQYCIYELDSYGGYP